MDLQLSRCYYLLLHTTCYLLLAATAFFLLPTNWLLLSTYYLHLAGGPTPPPTQVGAQLPHRKETRARRLTAEMAGDPPPLTW